MGQYNSNLSQCGYCCTGATEQQQLALNAHEQRNQVQQANENNPFKKIKQVQQQAGGESDHYQEYKNKTYKNNTDSQLISCIKIQSLYRSYIIRKYSKLMKLFKSQGLKRVTLDDVRKTPESNSSKVRQIEKQLGLQSFFKKFKIDQRGMQSSSKVHQVRQNTMPNEISNFELKAGVKFPNGTIYTGQFDQKNLFREGFGIQVWPDGSKYIGQWKHGKANGFGRFILAEGDIYEGDWKDDKAHGYGFYNYADGSSYEGYWANDKQEGEGREKWPDGSFYQGQYQNGKKFGKGKFVWADGACYEGEWQGNKMHGKGIFKWTDGRVYEGFYQNDRKHGFGLFKWPDGRQVQGEWRNGKQVVNDLDSLKESVNDSHRYIAQ